MSKVGITAVIFVFSVLFHGCHTTNPRPNDNSNSTAHPYTNPKPEHHEIAKRIDSLAHQAHAEDKFNGVALVAHKGEKIYHQAFGVRNFRTEDSLSKHDCFQLASVSKMFTAYAIGILQEDKRIHVDSLVTYYLPDFPYSGIKVRHLLNHTSGLPRYMVVSDNHFNRDSVLSNFAMHCLMERYKPRKYFKPNFRYNYQNTNYAYLALLVEVITGKSFSQFCREEIFEPLQMYDSFVYDRRHVKDIPCKVEGHIYSRARVFDEASNYLNGVTGDKGIYSNALDLLKFDRELRYPTLVSRDWIEASFTRGNPTYKSSYYGFGWRIDKDYPGLVYHYGWWNGFKSCFMRFTDSEYSIIVLTNRDRSLDLPGQIKELLVARVS